MRLPDFMTLAEPEEFYLNKSVSEVSKNVVEKISEIFLISPLNLIFVVDSWKILYVLHVCSSFLVLFVFSLG